MFLFRLIVAVILFSCSAYSSEVPSDVTSIEMTLPSGWRLLIGADGRGMISLPYRPETVANIPAGTYAFEAIYKAFSSEWKVEEAEDSFLLGVRRNGQQYIKDRFYSRNYSMLLDVIAVAKVNYVALNPRQVKAALESNPIDEFKKSQK